MPDTWTPIFDLSNKEKVQQINDNAELEIDYIIKQIKTFTIGNFMKNNLKKKLIKLQTSYTLLLEFIFPFSVTGYRFNNICLHQIGKKFWSTWTFQPKKFHNCTSSKHLIETKLFKKSMDMNRRFYREITIFFGKYTFNIHFFVLNVHFSILNIHFCNPNVHFLFVQKSTYMKVSIMKLIFLVQKQISEKRFQMPPSSMRLQQT